MPGNPLRCRCATGLCSHFMQELGRLCRYPTATGGPHLLPSIRLSQHSQADYESCLRALKEALVYMYGRGEIQIR